MRDGVGIHMFNLSKSLHWKISHRYLTLAQQGPESIPWGSKVVGSQHSQCKVSGSKLIFFPKVALRKAGVIWAAVLWHQMWRWPSASNRSSEQWKTSWHEIMVTSRICEYLQHLAALLKDLKARRPCFLIFLGFGVISTCKSSCNSHALPAKPALPMLSTWNSSAKLV